MFNETALENKALRILVVFLSICAIAFGILLNKERYLTEAELKTKVRSLEAKADSLIEINSKLHNKLYATENELSRFEYTLDYMKGANPLAAAQFEDYLYSKTE